MNWHPYAEEWPLLKDVDPAGWEAFKSGIKETNGIADNPIRFRVVDGAVEGLDGRNRYFACKELGIKSRMKKVRVSDEEVTDYVDRWNLHRRHHMTPELRQKLVVKRRELGESLRAIAESLGVHHSTVAEDLDNANAPGVGNPTPGRRKQAGKRQPARKKVKGRDGKTYPARRSKLSPAAQQRFDSGKITPRLRADFEELTHKQQDEVLLLIDSGCDARVAVRRLVFGEPGDEEAAKRGTKSGQPVYDLKEYAGIFGALYRQVDRVRDLHRLETNSASEELERDLRAWDAKFRAWHSEVTKSAKG